MAIYIHTLTKLNDSGIDPVSRTEAKNWMRVEYTDDDTLIDGLIDSSRKHLEKLTGLALTSQKYSAIIETTGINSPIWVFDPPYGPMWCDPVVKKKNGINDFETLVENTDYEVLGDKIWLYTQGFYKIEYNTGYTVIPEDLTNDINTLVAWMYENRGKNFQGSARQDLVKQYPNWDGLNYHQYKKVVI